MDAYLCIGMGDFSRKFRGYVTRNPSFQGVSLGERLVKVEKFPTANLAYAALDRFSALRPEKQKSEVRISNAKLVAIKPPRPLVIAGGGEDDEWLNDRIQGFRRIVKMGRWDSLRAQVSSNLERLYGSQEAKKIVRAIEDSFDEPDAEGGVGACLKIGPKPKVGSDAKSIPTFDLELLVAH